MNKFAFDKKISLAFSTNADDVEWLLNNMENVHIYVIDNCVSFFFFG